jgi:hypothetical protein
MPKKQVTHSPLKLVGQRTNLLVDEAVTWSPSVRLVAAGNTVDRGLRVNGQESEFVQLRKVLRDNGCLGRRGFVRPRQGSEPTTTEGCEQFPNVLFGLWESPQLVRFRFLFTVTTVSI